MTAEERLQFIELRKREIDLARTMVQKPDDVSLWTKWYSVAMQVDELLEDADPQEQEILNDLNKVLRTVYTGAFSFEHLTLAKGETRSDSAQKKPRPGEPGLGHQTR